MPGVTRINLDTAGGAVLQGPNFTVFVNGSPAATLNCPVAGHGKSPHSGARIVTSSGTVRAQNVPICRSGDMASCGHSATGSGNVFAG